MIYTRHPSRRQSSAAASLAILIAVAFSGCDKKENLREGIDPLPEVAAEGTIGDSFRLTNDAESTAGEARQEIAIAKSALEKEFLLRGSLITQSVVPQWGGLKTRVVAFRKRNNQVYMLEASQGHRVSDSLDQTLLIAAFPIKTETETHLTLDLAAGLDKLYFVGDWYVQDFSGDGYIGNGQEAVKVSLSYVERAVFATTTRMEFDYVTQLELSGAAGVTSHLNAVVKFALEPYAPNAAFVPTKSKDFLRMGFFEVAPKLQLESGAPIVHASKWHVGQPITFAISPNTPDDYRQAVRDGILYWNKAMGKEVIKVIDAPEGVTAPRYDYNVVQWVNWDEAGSAYADAQMDPRTGEILNAQVYMTSAFAVGGRQRAYALLRKLKDTAEAGDSAEENSIAHVSLKGLSKKAICDRTHSEHFALDLAELLASDADDAKILKMSQDYVREVMAHEVGHTLGLRHNFAGSLAANYTLADREGHVKTYLETAKAPAGIIPSSSVMEYQVFMEGAWTGDLMTQESADVPALSYDAKAMQHLYFNRRFDKSELPLFCTDSHTAAPVRYVDCNRFDIGASYVDYLGWRGERAISRLARSQAESFVATKAPAPGYEPEDLEKGLFPAEMVSMLVAGARPGVLELLNDDARFLSIWREQDHISAHEIEGLKEKRDARIQEQLAAHGGFGRLMNFVTDDVVEQIIAEFERLITSPEFVNGRGLSDQDYSFSDAEIAKMQSLVRKSYARAPKLSIEAEVDAWTGVANLPETPVSDALAVELKGLVEKVVMATSGENTYEVTFVIDDKGATEDATITLPVFTYETELRVKAAKLMDKAKSKYRGWSLEERIEFKDALAAKLEEKLTKPVATVKTKGLPLPVVRWIVENKEVWAAVPAP